MACIQVKQLYTSATSNENLFVALVFYGLKWWSLFV